MTYRKHEDQKLLPKDHVDDSVVTDPDADVARVALKGPRCGRYRMCPQQAQGLK